MMRPMNFAQLDGQHVELLPARTVLSLFSVDGNAGSPGSDGQGDPGSGHNEGGISTGGQVESEGQGVPGQGGSANPGG
jgi:hypothetical protein